MWSKLKVGGAAAIIMVVVAMAIQAKAQSTSPDANEAAALNPATAAKGFIASNGWTTERTINAKPKPLPNVDPAAVRAASRPKQGVNPAGKVGGESNEFR